MFEHRLSRTLAYASTAVIDNGIQVYTTDNFFRQVISTVVFLEVPS